MADQKKDGIIGNNHGILNAGKPYIPLIEKMAIKYRIPEVLISHQMHQESNFYPGAVSSAGAIGIMQIMPPTADVLSKRHNLLSGPLTNPEINADLGVAYMRELYNVARRFTSDPKEAYKLALVGYFAGPARIQKIADGGAMTRGETNYVDGITWDFEKTESWNQIGLQVPVKKQSALWPLLIVGAAYWAYKRFK